MYIFMDGGRDDRAASRWTIKNVKSDPNGLSCVPWSRMNHTNPYKSSTSHFIINTFAAQLSRVSQMLQKKVS